MKVIQGLLDALAALGAFFGLYLAYAAFRETGAPQMAALAALAVAVTVVPYCLAATNHRAHMRRHFLNVDGAS